MKYCIVLAFLHIALGVKVKVTMHSDQEDSKLDDDEMVFRTDTWEPKKHVEATVTPHKKHRKHVDDEAEYKDDKSTTEKTIQMHPNDLLFPLIYKQNHINSMFKFGENWYTWSTEQRTDGTKATNYFICYDEPKHCDEIGWERTDALPKCAFQLDSLMPDDRACINSFGIEPHSHGVCDGGEQMKVSEIVRACGPRIRSLWRFVRVSKRPPHASKPADVNSLVCEDEQECYVSVEYRIHHDRITFSLNEPTRGQTYKSALKRDIPTEDENKISVTERERARRVLTKEKVHEETFPRASKKFRLRNRSKGGDGKSVNKEPSESTYVKRAEHRNKVIKVREDVSEDRSD